jgi:hypothetical protein
LLSFAAQLIAIEAKPKLDRLARRKQTAASAGFAKIARQLHCMTDQETHPEYLPERTRLAPIILSVMLRLTLRVNYSTMINQLFGKKMKMIHNKLVYAQRKSIECYLFALNIKCRPNCKKNHLAHNHYYPNCINMPDYLLVTIMSNSVAHDCTSNMAPHALVVTIAV